MARLVVALLGVVLLALLARAGVWLLGQLFIGIGALVVGTAGVLGRLIWFLLVAGVLCSMVYFVTSSWRRPGA